MTDESCCMCGSTEKTHPCGDDFQCDRCCNMVMGMPDELTSLFDWFENVVRPHVIELKRKANQLPKVCSHFWEIDHDLQKEYCKWCGLRKS